MVECQWDSVVPCPYSPVLTGLVLTFMGVTRSNSGLFSTPGFVFSPVGKENGGNNKTKRRRERGEKGIEKERKEGNRNKERS